MNAVLGWKGASIIRQRAARVAAESPELQPLFAKLQSVERQRSTMARLPRPKDGNAWDKQWTSLAEEKERLEADLVKRSDDFRRAMRKVSNEELQSLLPTGAVLIDYVEYTRYSPSPIGRGKLLTQPALLALVVRPGRDVEMFSLGETASIAKAIDRWRSDFGQSPDSERAAEMLRARLWSPIAKAIGGAATVLISPDASLGRLPFQVLPGKEPGSYLIEDIELISVPVPRLLPTLLDTPSDPPTTELLVLGGIDYDSQIAEHSDTIPSNAEHLQPQHNKTADLQSIVSGRRWSFLPGAYDEMNSIRDLYFDARGIPPHSSRVVALSGREATEEAFRQLAPGAETLHLATH
jgi:hypothetical protein